MAIGAVASGVLREKMSSMQGEDCSFEKGSYSKILSMCYWFPLGGAMFAVLLLYGENKGLIATVTFIESAIFGGGFFMGVNEAIFRDTTDESYALRGRTKLLILFHTGTWFVSAAVCATVAIFSLLGEERA